MNNTSNAPEHKADTAAWLKAQPQSVQDAYVYLLTKTAPGLFILIEESPPSEEFPFSQEDLLLAAQFLVQEGKLERTKNPLGFIYVATSNKLRIWGEAQIMSSIRPRVFCFILIGSVILTAAVVALSCYLKE